MKNFVYLVFSITLFSCSKTETPVDFRIKSEKFYKNDTLIGQADFQYTVFDQAIISLETINFPGNLYIRHTYVYMNDSIQVTEAAIDLANPDTVRNLITLNIFGTKHLISRVSIFDQIHSFVSFNRDYQYDGYGHLTQINYFTVKQAYDFSFNGANLNSHKFLVPRLIPPYGTDTSEFDYTYTTRTAQPAINFNYLVNSFAINGLIEPSMNVELAGCTFNTGDKLINFFQVETFGSASNPVISLNYGYTFDNKGRVASKTYQQQIGLITETHKVAYEYF